jgi:hypothetical protein
MKTQGSVAGVVIYLEARKFGVRIPEGGKDPVSYLICKIFLFPGVKRTGWEAEHLHSCSAKVKNEWSCDLQSPTGFHVVYRENFTFNFYLKTSVRIVF